MFYGTEGYMELAAGPVYGKLFVNGRKNHLKAQTRQKQTN